MFFKSELENTKKHVEEKGHQKRKRPETGHVSHLCRCCKMELKRGPNSPHIHMFSPHTGFPGVNMFIALIRSFSFTNLRTCRKMTWRKFKESAFYKMEIQKWLAEFFFVCFYILPLRNI